MYTTFHLLAVLSIMSMFFSQGHALPQLSLNPLLGSLPCSLGGLIGTPGCPLPDMTTHPSPQCAAINQGAYICCRSEVNGGNALVRSLAAAADYQVTPNSINGLHCTRDFTVCNAITLCCQVELLMPTVGLYCARAN